MHIFTGMLVAALLGKHKSFSLLPLLRFGPVRTTHFLPSRVRFCVPALMADDSRADLLREKLPTLKGIRSVAVNPKTGSVLVHYREDQVRPELLFAAIVRLIGTEKEYENSPRPKVVEELRSVSGQSEPNGL